MYFDSTQLAAIEDARHTMMDASKKLRLQKYLRDAGYATGGALLLANSDSILPGGVKLLNTKLANATVSSRIASVTSDPLIREYAQGAAQSQIQPVADWIAPVVEVANMSGRFMIYDKDTPFILPETRRSIGGRATMIEWPKNAGRYDCSPFALDHPVDFMEQREASSIEDLVKEGAMIVGQLAMLTHEYSVITTALANATTSSKVWAEATNPIPDIDAAIVAVAKAARMSSGMQIRVLIGIGAWLLLKEHPLVRARILATTQRQVTNPTLDDLSKILFMNPECRVCTTMIGTNAPGVASNVDWAMNNKIMIFVASPSPTRRDPSFMKTFRLSGQWMVPRSYTRDDNRVEVVGYDWSEDVQAANAAASVLYNVSTS